MPRKEDVKKRLRVSTPQMDVETRAPSELETEPMQYTQQNRSLDNQAFPRVVDLTQPNVDIAARGRRVSGYPEQPEVTKPGRTGDYMWGEAIARRGGLGKPRAAADNLNPRLDSSEDVVPSRPSTDISAPRPLPDPDEVKADELERQANAPAPRPQGFKQNLIVGVRNALEGLSGNYFKQEAFRQDTQEQNRRDLLAQVQSHRNAAEARAREARLAQEHKETVDVANRRTAVDEGELALKQKAASQPRLLQQSPGEQDILYDPASGQQIASFEGPAAKSTVPKSLQPMQVEFVNGRTGMANYHPDTGKYSDPVSEADITASVKGKYEKPTQEQYTTIRTVDDMGNPVERIVPKRPSEFTAAPTAQEDNRRSQAEIISNYADHLNQLIDAAPNAVGPLLGRLARGEIKIGQVPPEVKALHTALGSFEALQPILHGFRGGSQTVDHFHSVLGGQELSASALKASINEIKNLAETIKMGTKGPETRVTAKPVPGATADDPMGLFTK